MLSKIVRNSSNVYKKISITSCKTTSYADLERRERDSNPRYLAVRRFSRPVHSTTLPSLHANYGRLFVFASAKIHNVWQYAKYLLYFFSQIAHCRELMCQCADI